MEPKIYVEPDAWATKTMCIGPEYGKVRYSDKPIQSLSPLMYTHEKLYSEKTVIGLMKAAYYDGYTDREQKIRDGLVACETPIGGWTHLYKDGERHTSYEKTCPHGCGATGSITRGIIHEDSNKEPSDD